MAAHALIFDLDGTVWDSAGWFAAALGDGDAEASAGIAAELVAGGNVIGVLQRTGMTRRRLLRDATARSGPPPLFDGMRDALDALRTRGTRLGVATSLPGSLAEPMLEAAGVDRLFGSVVHAGLCRTGKPHPRSLLMAAAGLGVAPGSDIHYVGDRLVDAEAARRAGMGAVWIAHGYERPPAGSGVAVRAPAGLLDL